MSAAADPGAAVFEAHRRAPIGLAYRMLGSVAEAEDVVQDAWLRWHKPNGRQCGIPAPSCTALSPGSAWTG